MIKNYYKRIFRILVLIFVFTVIGIHVVHGQAAASSFTSFLGVPDIYGLVNQVLGWLANYLLMIMSLLLSMAAAALNTSIVITMHIREFVDSTPVIYEVWKIIRDISGIFFIFVLLIAAIKIILGLDTKISEVIKNIVIAGVLINFSFFIVSVLIDASNIVSQTIYNAMIPNSPAVTMSDFGPAVSDGKGGSNGGIKALTQKYFSNTPSKGSITDIFMQSLSVQSLYNKQLMNNNQYKNIDNNSSSGIMTMIKIILIAVVGSIIMFTSAVSFMIAAGAFIVRLVILLFLLAFSPIYFAGMVIPGIKEYVGDFKNQLQSQLIFMPVYLLLMYVALRVLNESKILGTGYMQLYQGNLGNSWAIDLIALGVNFALVIVILNIPLIGAMKLGGSATKLFSNLASKYGASNVWKNVGSFAGRNTIGASAAMLNNSQIAKSFYANTPGLGRIVNNRLSKISGSGFGVKGGSYDQTRKEHVESVRKFADSLGHNPAELEGQKFEARKQAVGIRYDKNLEEKFNDLAILENEMNAALDPELKRQKTTEFNKAQNEYNKLVNERESKIEELARKEVENERKNKVADYYENGVRNTVLGAVGVKPKFNMDIVRAIKKEKKESDEIMNLLRRIDGKAGNSGDSKK